MQPADPAWLEAAALHYLGRYQASAESLRRVMLRKIRRRAMRAGLDPAETLAAALPQIDALVTRYLKTGILDDEAFAKAKTASLHRRGHSRRSIAVRLQAKGIDATLVAELAGDEEELRPGGDLGAAVALARRRRLGPFRQRVQDGSADRDLAALCRAGFALETARRVMRCADPEAAEALAAELA